MKAYILTVIGATLLSAFAGNLAPDKWQKYVKVITGLVLIICILSPIKSLVSVDLFDDFEISDYDVPKGKTQAEIVISELEEKICEDIEARMKKEFNISVSAQVEIDVNSEGEIVGVRSIYLTGERITAAAAARLKEIYGAVEVYNE
jgi:hypothetical protein